MLTGVDDVEAGRVGIGVVGDLGSRRRAPRGLGGPVHDVRGAALRVDVVAVGEQNPLAVLRPPRQRTVAARSAWLERLRESAQRVGVGSERRCGCAAQQFRPLRRDRSSLAEHGVGGRRKRDQRHGALGVTSARSGSVDWSRPARRAMIARADRVGVAVDPERERHVVVGAEGVEPGVERGAPGRPRRSSPARTRRSGPSTRSGRGAASGRAEGPRPERRQRLARASAKRSQRVVLGLLDAPRRRARGGRRDRRRRRAAARPDRRGRPRGRSPAPASSGSSTPGRERRRASRAAPSRRCRATNSPVGPAPLWITGTPQAIASAAGRQKPSAR